MSEPSDGALEPRPRRALVDPADLPVVARMVIEVRSDGTRTMARGALEDLVTGEQVAIETGVLTPLDLTLSLSRTLLALPGLGTARMALKALVPGRLKRLLRRTD